MWGYEKKNIYQGIRTSFFVVFDLLFFSFFFALAQERGILNLCAVTWLDGDRHLERWHSAGPTAAATQDREHRCVQPGL